MQHINLDRFNNIDPDRVGHVGMQVLHAIQDNPKEEQVAALAASFLILSASLGVEAQDAFTVVRNLLNAASHEAEGLRALRLYAYNGMN